WPQQVMLESNTYRVQARPGVMWRYGVGLAAVCLGGRRQSAPADRLLKRLWPPDRFAHLATYDRIVANSQFTARWVRRLWGRDSDVLYPPVRLVAGASNAKDPIVLNIGRFFDPRRGHSKKQLEMVEAFHALHVAGDNPGWTLH